jgi:hypothetical protein
MQNGWEEANYGLHTPFVEAGKAKLTNQGTLTSGAGDERGILAQPLLREHGKEGGGEAERQAREP